MSSSGTMLAKAILALDASQKRLARKSDRAALAGQPFDRLLLSRSALYRRSRELYALAGGTHEASLLSSPRSLSSAALFVPRIQYSPVENEMLWAANDRSARESLLALRTWVTSVFHEQNHRTFWKELPPPPRESGALRRYLNFSESLVVMIDMALSDELGPALARPLWMAGAVYDPGSTAKVDIKGRRDYRNYLQAVLLATYLNLELYDRRRIPPFVRSQFPVSGEPAVRAATRACNLDRAFVTRTNPLWQSRHAGSAAKALARPGEAPLHLPSDPSDTRLVYLWGERMLDLFKI